MKRVATAVLSMLLTCSAAAWAAPQAPVIEASRVQAKDVGYSLGAAAINLFYFPVRLAVTTVTAAAGGLTGFLIGGDQPAATAVWDSTDGQAFITPEILDGSVPLQPFRRPPERFISSTALGGESDYGDVEPEAPVAPSLADEGGYEAYEPMQEAEPY